MKPAWLVYRLKHINSYFHIEASVVGGLRGHQWHWNKLERRFIYVGITIIASDMLSRWKNVMTPPKRLLSRIKVKQ